VGFLQENVPAVRSDGELVSEENAPPPVPGTKSADEERERQFASEGEVPEEEQKTHPVSKMELPEETPAQEQVSPAKTTRHPGHAIKNVAMIVISVILTIILIDILMQHAAMFQHGGDRAPRNDPNVTWDKPAGITRIMIVGDALTYGDGVTAVETYPYQLKEKLQARLEGQFQVVNLGILGLNTDQQALILTRPNPYFGEPVLKLDPDLVILTFSVDDIEGRPDPRERPEIALLPRDVHQFLSDRSRLYLLLHRTFNDALSSTGTRPSYSAYLQRLYREHRPKWQEFQQSLNLFIDTIQQAQKPMLLVIFPALEHLDATHPFLDLYTHVKDQASAKGVEVLNLFPAFYGKDASTLRVSLLNNHPNAEAYEIAAEAIYHALIEENLLSQQ
jgi:lysophospholipase L1-like esterase